MKLMITNLCLVLVVSCSLTAQENKPDISQLKWLSGCWEKTGDNYRSTEMWMDPDGQTMPGIGRVIKNGKTVNYEFMMIHTKEDEKIYLTAKPSGQTEASFLLTKLSSEEAVFENPQHDYPQLISYRINEKGQLIAYVEGKIKNEIRSFTIEMDRTECGENNKKK
jgi:hypothetical protein